MPGPFELSNDEIIRLNAYEFADEFRKLLHAECLRAGIQSCNISITQAITIADGGIDAEVGGIPVGKLSQFLSPGLMAFQFKAGNNFSPTADGDLQNELLTRTKIKPMVQKCIDKQGTFVLISSKKDLTSKDCGIAEDKIKKLLNYSKVKVWGPGNLVLFYRCFPQLVLNLKQVAGQFYASHDEWALQTDMENHFVPTEGQQRTIAAIHQFLLEKENVHQRLCGDPGVGKTRAVLEATRDDRFKGSTIYFQNPDDFHQSPLAHHLLHNVDTNAICIVDECDDNEASELNRRYSALSSRLKFITLNPDSQGLRRTILLRAERLTETEIRSILGQFPLSPEIVSQLIPFCEGSPRAAVLLAENIRANPGDPFGTDGTPWKRFLFGRTRFDDPDVRRHEDILLFLSMFRKFGAEVKYAEELSTIRGLYNKYRDPTVTERHFTEAIRFFQARKLLQGKATFYISPKALHLYLWKTWWDQYGAAFRVLEFTPELTGALETYFFEMFEYASASTIAQNVARRLLEDGGALQLSFLNSDAQSRFFLTLTKVAPEEALHLLENGLGQKKKHELTQYNEGRRHIVWALEWLSQWRVYFVRASNLLVKLAEAENESISNNASGVFTNLFAGYSRLANTEAEPSLRLPILKQLLATADADRRTLAFSAIEKGLEADHINKMISFPESPFEKQPNFWTPKTYGELFEYYKSLWKLSIENFRASSEDEKKRIVKIICRHLRGLLRINVLSEEFLEDVKSLYLESGVDQHEILKSVADLVKFEKDTMAVKAYETAKSFLEEQTEKDFLSKFDRYVVHGIDSEEYESGNSHYERGIEKAAELALYAFEHPSEFDPLLPRLFAERALHSNEFGKTLGDLDKESLWYPKIFAFLKQGQQKNLSFSVSYLSQRIRHNGITWDNLMQDAAEADHMVLLVMVGAVVGIPDKVAGAIIANLKKKKIQVDALEYFRWGKSIQILSEQSFYELMEFLLSSEAGELGPVFCISLCTTYFIDENRKNLLPTNEFLLKVLTHPILGGRQQLNLFDYDWERLTKYFLKHYPESAPPFIDYFFMHFCERGTLFDKHAHYSGVIAHELLRHFPYESWGVIKLQLNPPMDTRQYLLWHWLHGHMQDNQDSHGAFRAIPKEALFAWIDERKEERASLVAQFIPAGFGELNWNLIRDILIRYGSTQNVRMNVRRCFTSEGWAGPFSLHYQKKLELLQNKLEGETETNVISWVQSFSDDLKKAIEEEKMKEERSRFGF